MAQIAEHSVNFLWVLVQLGELHLVKATLSYVAIIDVITSHNSQAIAIYSGLALYKSQESARLNCSTQSIIERVCNTHSTTTVIYVYYILSKHLLLQWI